MIKNDGLRTSDYWRERAEEARTRAEGLRDASATSFSRVEDRPPGGPSRGFIRVITAIVSMKLATVRIPGRKPARNSCEMLVSVNRP